MADTVKAPWQLQSKVDADGKPIEREPEAGDYLSALSMLLGLVAFWAKVRCLPFFRSSVCPFLVKVAAIWAPDEDLWLAIAVCLFFGHCAHEICRHGLLESCCTSDVSVSPSLSLAPEVGESSVAIPRFSVMGLFMIYAQEAQQQS
jgi:hypothetical protein